MKVLLLNRSYYPNIGGIENSLYFLSRELDQMGHDATILTQESAKEYALRKEWASIVTFPRFTFRKWQLPWIPSITEKKAASWIMEHKTALEADRVICRDPMLGLAYAKVFPNAKITYIPAVVVKYYNKGIRKSKGLMPFIKEVIRYFQLKIEEKQQMKIMAVSDKVVVFSKNVKDQIKSGNVCDVDKVWVCHPGVSRNISCCRERADDAPVFLFVGRLVDEKNLEMLLKATNRLDCKNKKLLIVGDGPKRTDLQRLTEELDLGSNVIFTGETSEPEKYYKQADFFVLPSKYESFGQVIAEALTAGLPVIGFKTIRGKTLTAIDELIQEGSNGFVCGEFSDEALCETMTKAVAVFHNAKQYAQMRENSCLFAQENFSWKKLADACIS